MMELPSYICADAVPVCMQRMREIDFGRMAQLYREWNEKINVISRKDIDNVFEHHILHSLCIAFYLEKERPEDFAAWCAGAGTTAPADADSGKTGPLRVLDVGCGGGFPGIPLAAMFPQVHFTLCDSIGKKVLVAREVAAAMGLKNVECVHSRVEQLPGQWDYVVSRAVTSLDNFMPWVMGRYSRNILYLKGGDMTAELEACWKKFPKKMPSAELWEVSELLKNEYFEEKLVVNLGNCQK